MHAGETSEEEEEDAAGEVVDTAHTRLTVVDRGALSRRKEEQP